MGRGLNIDDSYLTKTPSSKQNYNAIGLAENNVPRGKTTIYILFFALSCALKILLSDPYFSHQINLFYFYVAYSVLSAKLSYQITSDF